MRRLVVFPLIVSLVMAVMPLYAQENLLTNGGMEQNNGDFGPYVGKGRGDLTVPQGWDIWLGQGDTGQFFNRGDQVFTFPHNGFDPSPVEGEWAMNLDGGFVQFNAAVFQTVSVSEGTDLVAEAKAWVQACDIDRDNDEIKCANNPEKDAKVRIGIDTNGGSDPNSGDIVWSGWQDPWDTWKDTKVEATATGGQVTVFLFATQAQVAGRNVVYWDDVKLYAGGEGGTTGEDEAAAPAATAVPTFPPFVDFVSPQGQRDDGSIVHTVREGDTIDSIAVAYGMTRQDIVDMNPNLGSTRFIRIGQEILIREALPTEPPPEPTSTPIPGGVATEDPDAPDVESAETVEEEVAELPNADAEEVDVEATQAALEESAGDAPDEEQSGGNLLDFASGAISGLGDGDAEEAPEMAVEDADSVEVAMAEDASTPEPTEVEMPTATPRPAVDITASTASVCVSLFEDINQNRLRESNESLLPNGVVTINQGDNAVGTYETDGNSEPHCFTELEAGDYVAVMQAPAGYGLTTPNQLRLPLTSGTSLNIEFGAAEGLEVALAPPPDTSQELGNSADEVLPAETPPLTDNIVAIGGIIIGALAGVVVIAGIGATILLRRAK